MNLPDLSAYLVGRDRLMALLDEARGAAAAALEGRPESLTPQLLVLGRGANPGDIDERWVFCLAVPFNEDEEKRPVLAGLGARLCAGQKVPLAAVLTAEAWASSPRPDTPRVEPRHDPARREVIVVAGLTLRGEGALLSAPVARDARNGMTPGAWEEGEGRVQHPLLAEFFAGWREAASDLAGRGRAGPRSPRR